MHDFDLVLIGTGSGNSIPGPSFDDWNVAIVEKGVFGGTCLNVGCIPSKMFVYAADVAETIRHSATYGIDATINGVDWPAIRDRVFNRIDPIAAGGEAYRRSDECPNITVFGGEGRFTGPKTLDVKLADGTTESITGRHIILGAGARPFIPPFTGIETVDYHTSDTIMRLDALPQKLIVMGGGYIAAELGHVFAALGSQVTMINRGYTLLRAEDTDIATRFTEVFARRIDLRGGSAVNRIWQDDDGIHVTVTRNGAAEQIDGDTILVATGRVPNGDILDVGAAGIDTDGNRVLVDEYFRTNVEGIWAFGDLSNTSQLKHLANAEVRALRHNLLVTEGQIAGPLQSIDTRFVPHAVFGMPQVAAVGLTEQQARDQGLDILVATKGYGATAYGWAMEDQDGFAKLIADANTRQLVGAHIIGAQASTLIQQLIQGMQFGQTVEEMARSQFYIHPALPELIENALLDF
ncbi:MAG: mycothione reductase [Actinomycetia bacterium]|nr:mycothione reductase [Actinomycetes bacterium]